MARAGFVVLLLLAASGCRFDPAGRCDTRADCAPGLDCLRGVCAACRSAADCAAWQGCGIDGLCAPLAGRCDGDADCAAWDACDATHACALRSDHCPNVACGALELCDPAHDCSLAAGRCNADADCPKWMASCTGATAPANTCLFPATAGDDVLMLGTLVEGDCRYGAASRATSAAASSAVETGFDCGAAPDGRGALDPVTGTIVYRHDEAAGGDVLRAFRRDALTWDAAVARWVFPPDPAANDDLALVPGACPITWDRWVMQAGTGKLTYACPITAEVRSFHDDAGADIPALTAVREVLAWNDGGAFLLVDGYGVLKVVDGAGVATTVTGLPTAWTALAARTSATGFNLALHETTTGDDEAWAIDDATGVATPTGTYATVPGAYSGVEWSVLDAGGNLWGGGYDGLREVILKRPLSPGTTAVSYSGWSQPSGSNDFTAATFKPFVRLDRILLLTRP